ncbi:MAG TPA: sigma factor-like helix-turn-helix DNA-binding protein [Bryobacteraceae bacterium]|jgi:hypothetical protein|nr:sigma factor-like helix-turn-helix DNA-binding protein [Bryobacteraceae bacterium]
METELFALGLDDRDSAIIARHYGLDGKGGANFQRIGDEVGLTRERVRQIVSETDLRQYFKTSGICALDRVIAAIVSNLPARAEELETMLQTSGLTRSVFRLEGLIAIAALLRRPAPFRVTSLNGTRFVVGTGYPSFREIATRARQKVRRYGMANLTACLVGRNKVGDGQREPQLIEAILTAQTDFLWLDRETGWFWFSDATNNRVANRIRKMLAVANPLKIGEVRAGLARMGDPLPPNKTLIAFCRQLPGIAVYGDTIQATSEINLGEVLNRTERDIFRLLSEHNGCMSNSELICQSHGLGMKRPTFYQCVTYSPIVSRYNRNHYRLIGWQTQGGATGS